MTDTAPIISPSHRERFTRWPRLILRLLLAAVFLYAGVIKIFDPYTFATAIDRYRLVSKTLATPMAFYLPWLEILTAIALLTPRFRRTGAILALILSTIFVTANATAVARGLNITCGCFGAFSPAPVHHALWRSVGLLVLTAIALLIDTRRAKSTS